MTKATVVAIITASDEGTKKVLLARRNTEPYRDFWSLPGGHIKPYETARNAVIREVKEEIGLDFEPSFFSYFDEIIPEKSIHAVVIVFEGHALGEVNLAEKEISEMMWLPIPKAQATPLAFLQNSILNKYANTINGKST